MIAAGALISATVLAVPISAARADSISLSPCNTSVLGQPFAPWGDPASYELVPGGDFEKSAWTLNAGAQRVAGSEPYAATGTLGHWSLMLPPGASAQSPSTCVDAGYPTLRFFITGAGAVAVSLVDGNTQVPLGVAVADAGWRPTLVMITPSAVLAATSDGIAEVSVKLVALSGLTQVDDVFVDPWNRG